MEYSITAVMVSKRKIASSGYLSTTADKEVLLKYILIGHDRTAKYVTAAHHKRSKQGTVVRPFICINAMILWSTDIS